MRGAKWGYGFCVFATLTFNPVFLSRAGEPIFFLTHNGQHALLLGTVLAITQDSIQFQPHAVISGQQIHLPILIRYQAATKGNNLKSILTPGDRAIVPINERGGKYWLTYGVSKVSSLNPATLKILSGDLLFDSVLMFQWYINTCGQENDFAADGSTLFVKQPENKLLPIARKHGEKWAPLVKAPFYKGACNQLFLTHKTFSVLPWLSGIVIGSVATYFAYRFMKSSQKATKFRS
jgi:hypothetical protein